MRRKTMRLLSGLILAASLGGVSFAREAAPADRLTYTESGQASWYGPRHEGLRTTSGERFDSSKLTAAHPSLPMGSYVRVTLQGSLRSIVVRVNDREPPHGVRCIDLSRAAAARLGIVASGVADVTLAQVDESEAAVEVAEAPDAPLAIAPRGRRHRHHARR